MIDFQTHIDSLRGGVHADIHNESYYCKQVLNNILYSDVQFNLPAPEPSLSGEFNIDLLVDVHSGEQNGSIIVVQHVTKFGKSDIIIGVLALKLKDNDHSFIVVDSKTVDKTAKEIEYIVDSKGHFRSRAIQLEAVEVVEDRAIHLFNNSTSLLARTTTDETKQTRLKPSDSEIFQVKVSHSHALSCIFQKTKTNNASLLVSFSP
ncbi:unnamed protein product [Rotaria sp. Silwood2]|nr:unnamed protein product [Rotaria sp. Silwood2]CAF4352620.1 unnamed protein product [Rotaria sp. Silwood2]CAF4563193.1 unnamed protein product [Rotaria sp. Silwood2]